MKANIGNSDTSNRENNTMQINKERIRENSVKCKNTMQITLDDDFNVPDSKADIDSIIREWGNPHADSVKVSGERAEVKGSLDFAFLYCGRNETNGKVMPYKMAGSMNFNENVNLPDNADGTYAVCDAKLEDLTVKAINSRKVSIKAIIAITVVCEELSEIQAAAGVEEDDGWHIQTLSEDVVYSELAVNLRDNLRIKESLSVPAGKPEVGEIIWEESCIKSFNSRLTDDGVSLNGEAGIFFMYIPVDESQPVQWVETTFPFEGKLDINGCSEDMVSFVQYRLISFTMEARPDYDGENREIAVEMVLDLSVRGYEERHQTVINDIYSPVKNITVKCDETKLKKLIVRNNGKCRVSQRVKTDRYAGIMQICNCSGTAQIDDISVEEDGIVINGAVIAAVFYVTSDDAVPMGGLKAVVPFSYKLQLTSCKDMDYTLDISVEQLSAVMTTKDEIEIKGSVSIDAICFEMYTCQAANECEITDYDEKEYLALPGIAGYISDGTQNMWNITKKYHTTMDMIKQQNSQLSDIDDLNYRPPRGQKLLLIKTPAI